jgi:hypothetical protein
MINTIIIKIVLVKFQKRRFNGILRTKNTKTNKTIVYSNSIISEDYNISSFFNKKFNNDKFKILILNE